MTLAMSSSPNRHRSPSNGGHHHRSPSNAGEPSQTHHPSILPAVLPTPAVIESVAGAAHYSGSNVEPLKHRHSSHDHHETHNHQKILDALRELYESRPTRALLENVWHPDAIYETPSVKCRGFRQYAAQWYAMPKLFSQSETVSIRVMSTSANPNRIVFTQTQRYKNRFMNRTISSVITVDLDEHDRIVRLTEHRGKEWLGVVRWLNANLWPLLVAIP